MRHLAAYLLLKLGGNDSPSKDDVTKALSAVGVQAEDATLDRMLAELEGKDLGEMLESGKEQLAKFGGGGGGGSGGGGGGVDSGGAVEEKEEEKKEEGRRDGLGRWYGYVRRRRRWRRLLSENHLLSTGIAESSFCS
jgi:large subunit ribosomal protein LP2